jgi:pimeloyl-ACP methyl ester carboxylesterase
MTIAYTDTGAGEAVVILHGLFGSRRNWVSIAKALSETHRVITVDMPNHGESDWLEPVTYEAMAEAIGAFITDQNLRGCTLMGHSMGGKTAMTLALTQSDLLSRLIVADISPVTYDHDNATNIEAMDVVDLSSLNSRNDADAQMAEVVDDPMLRAFFLQNLRRNGDAYEWRINLEGLKAGLGALHGFPTSEAQFDKRTLFIAGAESDYITPEYHGDIADLFSDVSHESIPGAQHWLHADKPKEFTAIVQDFLKA